MYIEVLPDQVHHLARGASATRSSSISTTSGTSSSTTGSTKTSWELGGQRRWPCRSDQWWWANSSSTSSSNSSIGGLVLMQ